MKKRTLEVSEETYEKIKSQLLEYEKIDLASLQDLVGKKVFFRTVTYHILGRVVKIFGGNIIQLEEASWVADSGRFADFIKTGIPKEVEPIGNWFVNLSSCTDFGIWNNALINTQK